MDWFLSGLSVVVFVLMGNKTVWGPILGIVSQALWIVYSVHTNQLGLIPGTAVVIVVQGRNLILWSRDHRTSRCSAKVLLARQAELARHRTALLVVFILARRAAILRRVHPRRRASAS